MDTDPSPTKLVLAIGPREADALVPLVQRHLHDLGDRSERVEVIASPFPWDAHCPAPGDERPSDLIAPDDDFRDWGLTLVQRPPDEAPLVWVFRHLDKAIGSLVRLARDPETHYLVIGDDPDCMAYMGSNVRYLAVGPATTEPQRDAVAAAIAVEVLFRFPTPERDPILPWAALARLNYYQPVGARGRPNPEPPFDAALASMLISPDGRWEWDGKVWRPHKVQDRSPVPGGPAQSFPTEPDQKPGQSTANGSAPRRRWPFGRPGTSTGPEPPMTAADVRALVPSHVPMTIEVTGIKGGVGKSLLAAGLLLAAQDAAPEGMPLLAVDSDPRHAYLSRFLGMKGSRPTLWDVVAHFRSTGEFVPPASSDSQIYAYEQGERIRQLDSMFDEEGNPKAGAYDLPSFMDHVHRQYQVVVVDGSSDPDIAFFWARVADAIVVATDASPPTVAKTQQYLGLYQYWRSQDPERGRLPIACAWISGFHSVTPEVKQRRQKIERGFDLTVAGERFHADGVPVVHIPRDQRAYDASDFHDLRRSPAMAAYRRLFGLLVKSMGPARMRV